MPFVGFCLLLAIYSLVVGQFFPNRNGTVGHDFSLGMPILLAGYYWFRGNGILDVPWFTPGFCGGQPFYADPQSTYYSVLQLLVLGTDPLSSAYVTTLLLAAFGFWGCYFLLRGCFAASRESSVVAAAIFMFNGFFAHRMIIGHLGYHGFMLVPWMAYLLLVPNPPGANRWLNTTVIGCLAGLVGAYWVQSGLGSLLIPTALAVGLILLTDWIVLARFRARQIVSRSLIGACIAISLSAAKVVANLAFLANFPRSDYLLPGFESIGAAMKIAALSLFVSPPDIERYSNMVSMNVQWSGGRADLEYGVTIVPLLIIVFGVCAGAARIATGKAGPIAIRSRAVPLIAAGLILFMPILFNTYSPWWNALLKQIPVLKSSSTLIRWFIIYIPFVAVLSALLFERSMGAMRSSVAIVAVALVVAVNLMQDRRSYMHEPYDPGPMIHAYWEARGRAMLPPIESIGVYRNADGRVVLPIYKNDALSQGYSSLYCYNPVFGYRLEKFPIRDLRPGPVREVRDGHFNIKNPACYVYPKENDCSPGDHFRVDQFQAMENFVSYRPFAFNISTAQKVANGLTMLGLAASALAIIAALGYLLVRVAARSRGA